MKFLTILFLTLTPMSAQAITWKEFWEPFRSERHYHYHPRYIPMCDVKVYREEYVPGNRWNRGYVRTWTEWERVPCEDLHDYWWLNTTTVIESMNSEDGITKWNRGLDLFIESVYKPDNDLRQCAHDQECFHELMEVRDQVIEHLKSLRRWYITSGLVYLQSVRIWLQRTKVLQDTTFYCGNMVDWHTKE